MKPRHAARSGVASRGEIHDPRRRVHDDSEAPGDRSDSATRIVDDPESTDGAGSNASTTAPHHCFASDAFSALLRAQLGRGVQTRLGRYLLLRILGEGGMGVVFSAYDEELDRRVAIKVLSVPATGGTTGRARIRREAQALAKVSHPNIVQIYEVGEEAGQIYLVMELIDGDNLRVWQAAASRSWREVLARWLEAGLGLAAAHKAGLIHRDLKPESRRPSQTAPQPTDRPHSRELGRFERVSLLRLAPHCPALPQVLAKLWQWVGVSLLA
jgi:hypothetical protein